MLPQSDDLKAQQSIVTNDLAGYIDSSNGSESRLGFPFNGCHEFEIEVSAEYMGIGGGVTTVILVCCVRALCIPNFGNRTQAGIKPGSSFTINDSSTVTFGDHTINIANGVYSINAQGEIVDLKYEVVTK